MSNSLIDNVVSGGPLIQKPVARSPFEQIQSKEQLLPVVRTIKSFFGNRTMMSQLLSHYHDRRMSYRKVIVSAWFSTCTLYLLGWLLSILTLIYIFYYLPMCIVGWFTCSHATLQQWVVTNPAGARQVPSKWLTIESNGQRMVAAAGVLCSGAPQYVGNGRGS